MVKFRVEGMTCGGCARGVTNALQRIDPKAEVAVDLAAKSVSVRSTASADQLRRGIEQAGYPASLSG